MKKLNSIYNIYILSRGGALALCLGEDAVEGGGEKMQAHIKLAGHLASEVPKTKEGNSVVVTSRLPGLKIYQ